MGAGTACISSCGTKDTIDQEHEVLRQREGLRWLTDSVFGPEPEHNKRLDWLQGDEKEWHGERQQFTIVVSDSLRAGAPDRVSDYGVDKKANNVEKDILKFAQLASNNATSGTALLPVQRGFSSEDDSPARDNSESPHYSPSASSQHLHPHSAILSIENLPGSDRIGTAPWEWREERTKSLPPAQMDRESTGRSYRSMIVTKWCSARFLEDTRFIQLSASASQLVYDLDSIHRELSIRGSSDVGDFQKSVIIATPSEFDSQKFLDAFMPFLEKKPEVFESLETLEFDAFKVATLPQPYNAMPLLTTTVAVLWRFKTIERLRISWLPVVKFLSNIEEAYNDNAYHSNWHAADVVATMAYFICRGWFKKSLSPVHHIISLLAAASHDVDHNAQNNNFHRLAKTPIGILYPESNLEYHHIAKATGIRNLPGCDWTVELQKFDETWTREEVWTLFSTLILRTDPALYDPENRKPFTDLATCTREELNESQEPALMEILHLADISNPVKPRGIAKAWASRFYSEFVDLGKEVRRLHIDMPMFHDPAKMPALHDTQVFFLSKICLPSFEDLVVFIPEVQETVDNLKLNLEYWKTEKERFASRKESAGGSKRSMGSLGNNASRRNSGSLGSLKSQHVSESDIHNSKVLSNDLQDSPSSDLGRSRIENRNSASSTKQKLSSLREMSRENFVITSSAEFQQYPDTVSPPSRSLGDSVSSGTRDSDEKGNYYNSKALEVHTARSSEKIYPAGKLSPIRAASSGELSATPSNSRSQDL